MRLKILQVNVWWGGKLWDNLIEFIKKENPEIIFAQEVYESTIKGFGQLGYEHVAFGKEMIDVREGGRYLTGNAIFSKFPILDYQTASYVREFGEFKEGIDDVAKAPRNILHAALSIEDKIINAFCTHGIVDYRGDYDSPERLEMSRIICEAIAGKDNAMLTGDFNVQPETQTIRNIEKHLSSVFKSELKSSFNMRRKTKPGYATATVDMIFVSPEIKVLEHSCPDVDVSDHYPLLAIIEI